MTGREVGGTRDGADTCPDGGAMGGGASGAVCPCSIPGSLRVAGGTPIGGLVAGIGTVLGGSGIPGGGGRGVTGVTGRGEAAAGSDSCWASLYGSLAARQTISQSPPPTRGRPKPQPDPDRAWRP